MDDLFGGMLDCNGDGTTDPIEADVKKMKSSPFRNLLRNGLAAVYKF